VGLNGCSETFVVVQKFLPKMLCGKAHCRDAKPTSSVRDFIVL
jgi:hypothetical protein